MAHVGAGFPGSGGLGGTSGCVLGGTGQGGAGGGVLGGTGQGGPSGGVLGGTGQGGVGGSRHNNFGDQSTKHNLKMSFPRFDGDQPRIWKEKCLDYFRLFNVNPALWLVSATLHMEGNAALWLKAYRLRHEINTWPQLMLAVEEKFGTDDHRRFMKQLLALKQQGTVEEYQTQFEQLSYQIAIQNPHYDEQFYVSQFIRGLKAEIRGSVEAHRFLKHWSLPFFLHWFSRKYRLNQDHGLSDSFCRMVLMHTLWEWTPTCMLRC
jgi:hypothetical protein